MQYFITFKESLAWHPKRQSPTHKQGGMLHAACEITVRPSDVWGQQMPNLEFDTRFTWAMAISRPWSPFCKQVGCLVNGRTHKKAHWLRKSAYVVGRQQPLCLQKCNIVGQPSNFSMADSNLVGQVKHLLWSHLSPHLIYHRSPNSIWRWSVGRSVRPSSIMWKCITPLSHLANTKHFTHLIGQRV